MKPPRLQVGPAGGRGLRGRGRGGGDDAVRREKCPLCVSMGSKKN